MALLTYQIAHSPNDGARKHHADEEQKQHALVDSLSWKTGSCRIGVMMFAGDEPEMVSRARMTVRCSGQPRANLSCCRGFRDGVEVQENFGRICASHSQSARKRSAAR